MKNEIRLILKIAFPLIIQGLVFQLQSLTDKAFLGNLDTRYVSAIGAAQMPYLSSADCVVAISTGLIIIVSKLFGASKKEQIPGYVKSIAFYHSLLGILLFVIWQLWVKNILVFFRVDSSIIDYSIEYVRICSVYFLMIGFECSLQAMLQGMGETRPIMYAGIIKVVINIIITYILVFGKLGFPAMHVTGAAIGTLVANVLSFIFILFYCFILSRKKFLLSIRSKDWFYPAPYLKMIHLGLPVGMEYLLWNASNLLLIRFINGFSYRDMAIYTLTFGFQCIIYVIFEGVSKSALTNMGQSLGAGNIKSVNGFFYTSMGINIIIVTIAVICFALFPSELLGIFSNDKTLIRDGVPYLIFIGFIMYPQSMNIICGNGIRAYDDTKWMLISQILGSILVVSVSWFMVEHLHMNMMAIYITIFIDETLRGMINFVYYRRKYGNKCLKSSS